jgi:S-adenosyl-L-methionine hydrolase (adenosine-forming)
MSKPIITLLTDFGLQDGYVASMKGVILSICPEAILVDITHEAPRHDIRSAAFLLHTVTSSFPRGTIHVVVVDPGVGTTRRGIVIQTPDAVLVGPDNGVFSWILHRTPGYEARTLDNAEYQRPQVSATFHGRDIFAPAAAHIAIGVVIDAFGPPCTPLMAPWTAPRLEAGTLHGEVIHIDRFGNAVTNIMRKDLERLSPRMEHLKVRTAGRDTAPLSRTYGDHPPDTLTALIGSCGHLEIAVTMGNCARRLGLKVEDPVTVTCYTC